MEAGLKNRLAGHYDNFKLELSAIGNPKTVQELLDLVSKEKPILIFLMEIKVSHVRVERVRK